MCDFVSPSPDLTAVTPTFSIVSRSTPLSVVGTHLEASLQYTCRLVSVANSSEEYFSMGTYNSTLDTVVCARAALPTSKLGRYQLWLRPETNPAGLLPYAQTPLVVDLRLEPNVTSFSPEFAQKSERTFVSITGTDFWTDAPQVLCYIGQYPAFSARVVSRTLVECVTDVFPVTGRLLISLSFNGKEYVYSRDPLIIYGEHEGGHDALTLSQTNPSSLRSSPTRCPSPRPTWPRCEESTLSIWAALS